MYLKEKNYCSSKAIANQGHIVILLIDLTGSVVDILELVEL